jgi:inorganic triphosphatase YgiF
MNQDEKMKLGMCWFDAEQWQLLKELDPEGTDDSYEEWRKQANSAFSELRAAGQNIVKVSIKINDLLTWCKEQGKDPVSSSRSEFAAFKLRMKDKAN